MSLDVCLYQKEKNVRSSKTGTGIFIRENGQTREITRAEWDTKFPDKEPYVATIEDSNDMPVFSANITHNLNRMADEAGIYKHLWRPEELGVVYASELIADLKIGLRTLKEAPHYFKQFNPANGWGNYDLLVSFVEAYLNACETYPTAKIGVSR